MFGVVDGVKNRQNSSSWISKDMLYMAEISMTSLNRV